MGAVPGAEIQPSEPSCLPVHLPSRGGLLNSKFKWIGLVFALGLIDCGFEQTRPPLAPHQTLYHLGSPDSSFTASGTTKPVLPATSTGGSEIAVSDLPEHRLYFAAAAEWTQSASAAPILRCAASLTTDGGTRQEVAHFELKPGAAWLEESADLPAISRGTLRFGCRDVPEGLQVRWAQPLAVPQSRTGEAPLIVLVSIDTLRADHVAGFGGRTDLTPELARRGAEGMLFTAASSEGIWTLPSHSALLFSRFPGLDPVQPDPMSMTLAEAFSSAGFATLGLTGGGWVSAKLGFSKGFDHYSGVSDHDDDFRGLIEGEMLSMIERFASVPTFLFLHTYSVHRQTQAIRNWIKRVRHIRSPENRARAREMAEHYAELVREADTDLAVLFSTLTRQASKRPVLLVLISDHGQALGEHGFVDHGVTVPLFDELVHVPFLVWGPGIVPAQRTSSFSVSLADVAPSLLASAGIAIPPNMQGTNLWPLWSGSNTENTTHAAPRGVTHHKRYWSLRSANRKLIVGLRKGRDPDIFLFDLAADPLERINLASSRPEEVLVLRGQLEARLRELGIKEMISTDKLDSNDHIDSIVLEDEKLRDRLRALGYLE